MNTSNGRKNTPTEHKLKFRCIDAAAIPKRTKLQVPGWAGAKALPVDGAEAQPWHCKPFVDGSTYGLELYYPYKAECRVRSTPQGFEFNGDFNQNKVERVLWPPFRYVVPNHYGFCTLLDLQVEPGHVLRTEPHPRFYTDTSNTVPICLVSHLETSWWPLYFFLTFKGPSIGQEHIFRYGEPFAQVLIMPSKVKYSVVPMTTEEFAERDYMSRYLSENRCKVGPRKWRSGNGFDFDNTYKKCAIAQSGTDEYSYLRTDEELTNDGVI